MSAYMKASRKNLAEKRIESSCRDPFCEQPRSIPSLRPSGGCEHPISSAVLNKDRHVISISQRLEILGLLTTQAGHR